MTKTEAVELMITTNCDGLRAMGAPDDQIAMMRQGLVMAFEVGAAALVDAGVLTDG